MRLIERTLGELDCQVVDTVPDGATPGVVMVICHGFGASGTDLVPVASDLLRVAPGLAGRVRFVFPAAPLSLDEVGMPGGRAWWHLDLQRLTAAIEQGDLRDQRADIPEGLPQARQLLHGLVEEIQHGLLANQGRCRNRSDAADHAVFGIAEEILGHGIIAKTIGNPKMDVRVKCTGEENFSLYVDFSFGLTES